VRAQGATQQVRTAVVLQVHALQPWMVLSPVRTTSTWAPGVMVTGEALEDAWGGCTGEGFGWVRRASMMSARSCKHGRRANSRTSHHVLLPAPNQHPCCCMQRLGLWPVPRRAMLQGPALLARSSCLGPCSELGGGKSPICRFSERETRTNGVGSSWEGQRRRWSLHGGILPAIAHAMDALLHRCSKCSSWATASISTNTSFQPLCFIVGVLLATLRMGVLGPLVCGMNQYGYPQLNLVIRDECKVQQRCACGILHCGQRRRRHGC
jgi:hypothetical protein